MIQIGSSFSCCPDILVDPSIALVSHFFPNPVTYRAGSGQEAPTRDGGAHADDAAPPFLLSARLTTALASDRRAELGPIRSLVRPDFIDALPDRRAGASRLPMSTRRSESDLTRLRRLAREAATGRKEAPSTIHLLAAVWRAGGPARELLDARRLDETRLLQAARMFDETDEAATELALESARRMAQQTAVPSRAMPALRGSRPTAAPEPSGIHVLVALVSSRHCAAYRALAQCGVDIANLRSAATRVALGVVTPPRRRRPRESALPATAVPVTAIPSTPPSAPPTDEPTPKRRRSSRPKPGAAPTGGAARRRRSTRAVQVPLIPPVPPPRKPSTTKPGLGETATTTTPEPPSPPPPRDDVEPRPSGVEDLVPSADGSPVDRSSDAETSSRARSERMSISSSGEGQGARRSESEPAKPSFASRPSVPDDDVESVRSSDRGLELTSSWGAVLDPERFPTLAALRNLTAAAALGELEPAVARDDEVQQALDVLAKRHANSPVLVGRAGVGKTTVAHAIAAELATEPIERARLLLAMPAADLLAGTGARGSLAEKLTALRDEVKRADGRVILFVDELHELLDGGLDEAVGELKTALASGDLPLLGATSPEEYRRCIESDAGLARRFTVVEVPEPSEEDALAMLRVVSQRLEAHHGVSYADEALRAAVSWSIRYLPGRALPDKALGVLDLAGARLHRRGRDRRLEPHHVAEIMAELVDVPRERLLESDQARMLRMADLLRERVVGHHEPCDRIAAVLRRNAAGLRGHRPLGTFLLLGPTGVGKTETAKAVAEVLFGAPDAMARLDMSEYAEPHAVARLVGAPPGYVGHEAGGLLTESVRKRPYQVILLDEIEKAHQDVLQAFLQVFDEGRLTDGRGRTVDFTNTVLVLTSNLGAREIGAAMNERPVGFGRSVRTSAPDADKMKGVAVAAARAALPPELYNRIDEVLFFRHLDRDDVRAVARRLLAALASSLGARGIRLDVDDSALEALLAQGGYDPELGARPMRRAIVRFVESPLADMILRGELEEGDVAMLSGEDGEVVVDVVSSGSRVA